MRNILIPICVLMLSCAPWYSAERFEKDQLFLEQDIGFRIGQGVAAREMVLDASNSISLRKTAADLAYRIAIEGMYSPAIDEVPDYLEQLVFPGLSDGDKAELKRWAATAAKVNDITATHLARFLLGIARGMKEVEARYE